MIKGQIIIKLSDGSIINYANKYLKKKTGTDGADPENQMFEGYPTSCYYYTGFGNDTYDKQLGAGTIKSDYEFLINQMDVAGNEILVWPENYTQKKAIEGGDKFNYDLEPSQGGGEKVLVRPVSTVINTGITYNRAKVFVNEIVSINIIEDWVTFPYGIESGYQFPKSDPNFYGFAESKERKAKGVSTGPDFDKYKTFDTGTIPMPIVDNSTGSIKVLNEKDYTGIVIKDMFDGTTQVYGYIDYETGTGTKRKNSASVYVEDWKMPSVIDYKDLAVEVAKAKEGEEYTILVDASKEKVTEFKGSISGETFAEGEFLPKSASQSPFGNKFAMSKGIFNVTIRLPNGIENTNFMLYKNDKIKSIIIKNGKTITSAENMFDGCSKLEKVETNNLLNVSNAKRMFSGCISLKDINTSMFSNVKNATNMFSGCTFTSINCKKMDKVELATGMFSNCANLKKVESLRMPNCTDASWMFYKCTSLDKQEINGLFNVANYSNMFNSSSITSADVSLIKGTDDATQMFEGAANLNDVTWGNAKPAKFDKMFEKASSKKIIKVYTEEARKFVDDNAAAMLLTEYEIKGPGVSVPPKKPDPVPVVKTVKTKSTKSTKSKTTPKAEATLEPIDGKE